MRTSATAALRDLTQIRFCPIRTFFFPRLRALLVAFYHAFSRRQVEEREERNLMDPRVQEIMPSPVRRGSIPFSAG